MHRKIRFLFILKQRHAYNNNGTNYKTDLSSGLYNAAFFTKSLLEELGCHCFVEQAVDNNDIDRFVTKHKPTHVFIEALWVIPEKFTILTKLHPKVKWYVRLHSEWPFLAQESIAVQWIAEYLEHKNVHISSNSFDVVASLRRLYREHDSKIVYHGNCYVFGEAYDRPAHSRHIVNIGCFGSIRPMKNQLTQAVAAILFANYHRLKLRFHINASRIESGSVGNELKNIRSLFATFPKHELVEHGWYTHDDFLKVVSKMDLGLQVSLTETFNTIGADFVSQNVPIVMSNAVPWCHELFAANPTDAGDICERLSFAWSNRFVDELMEKNAERLDAYLSLTEDHWFEFIETEKNLIK